MSEAEQSHKPQRDGSEERPAPESRDRRTGAAAGSGRATGTEVRPGSGDGAEAESGSGPKDPAPGGDTPRDAGDRAADAGPRSGAAAGGGPVVPRQTRGGERPDGKETSARDRPAKPGAGGPDPARADARAAAADGGVDDGPRDTAPRDTGTDAGRDTGTEAGDGSGAPAPGGRGEAAAVRTAAPDPGAPQDGPDGAARTPADGEKAPDAPDDARPPADRPRTSGTGGAAADRSGGGGGTGRGAKEPEDRLLAGRYRLGAVLGRGGMGTVWRAEDETLSRTVAVKELRFPNSIDEDEKRRLITRTLREAKAIARIRNTSAVTVFDVVDEDDRPWIVMELIEGKSLAEVIREDGTLTPRRAAEVGLAILDVLRSAHREGILHRDVKPSNVLISDDGRVVLTDFGIAQVEGDPSITSTGMLVGAPSYISPERARGHRPGPAADLWSLGGLLYASVEGAPPYDKGSAIATLTAVMTEPLDPPKHAGPLEEVIYGLLAKDPEQRLDDEGARALLTKALYAAEHPEPPADATRALALPPVPPPAPDPEPARPPAADRVRGALRSVRNASAASAAAGGADRAAGPAVPPRPEQPPARTAAARAPLTDVVDRRTLGVIAAVVVLVVLAAVLYVISSGSDEGDDGKKAGPAATAGATTGGTGEKTKGAPAATGGTGEKQRDPQKETGSGGSADSGGQTGSGDTGGTPGTGEGGHGGTNSGQGEEIPPPGTAMPAGYAAVTDDRFRFSMAMPEGFRRTAIAGFNSGGIYNRAKGAHPRVQIDFNSRPGTDAAAAWAGAVAATRAASREYKHLGIKVVEYNGYPTVADWSFERTENGKRVRVLNRGFRIDSGRGYSIMVTCEKDKWDEPECRTLRDTAFATFRPKD
jgi:eukaryotic-like serine/threonine-protein kinase